MASRESWDQWIEQQVANWRMGKVLASSAWLDLCAQAYAWERLPRQTGKTITIRRWLTKAAAD